MHRLSVCLCSFIAGLHALTFAASSDENVHLHWKYSAWETWFGSEYPLSSQNKADESRYALSTHLFFFPATENRRRVYSPPPPLLYSFSDSYVLHHPLLWATQTDNHDNNNNYPYKVHFTAFWSMNEVYSLLPVSLKPALFSLKMKLARHLILIHDYVLERFIQDHFLLWDFWGSKCTIANLSTHLKKPYNRFFYFFF